jgi:hypothetical protein
MKLDFIRVEKDVLVHKQMEKRDGRIFMRIRKMPVLKVQSPTVC